MRRPQVAHKPPAPSVRETIGPAIERSRSLVTGEYPMTRQEVVKDMLPKLDLPPALRARLKELYKLQ